MKYKFSHYLKKKKPLLISLRDRLLKDYKYVSILATDVSGTSYAVDSRMQFISPSTIDECGFVLRVYQNGFYFEYSFNDINDKLIDEIIRKVKELTKNEPNNHIKVDVFNEEPLKKSFNRYPVGKKYATEEIMANLKEMVEYGMTFDSIIFARAAVEVVEISKMFLSEAKDLEQYYTWNNPRTYAIAKNNDNTKYAYDGFGSNNLEEDFIKLKDSMKSTCELAKKLLSSTMPKPGVYDIITDPSITGLIAHEAFGHGVEMDMYVKDRAKSKEYMNKMVASPLISMHDGASAWHSSASYFFDDDGVLAHDTLIIDKGKLVSGISDALSAFELGKKPTGNGRRESYMRKSYTRMTNTFFEAGNDSLEDMIKSIDYGFYISKTNNGMEDPKNWNIQCTALYGLEIKNGEFTGNIISPVVMSGNVIDLLKSITMVSNNFDVIGSGSCGKGYKEWVRVSDGGASLKARVKIG